MAGAGVALALSWYLTGVLARVPFRFSVLDYPNDRSLHKVFVCDYLCISSFKFRFRISRCR